VKKFNEAQIALGSATASIRQKQQYEWEIARDAGDNDSSGKVKIFLTVGGNNHGVSNSPLKIKSKRKDGVGSENSESDSLIFQRHRCIELQFDSNEAGIKMCDEQSDDDDNDSCS